MAITDINISEQLETGAPSIKYTGKEGPRPSMQSQQEMMIAQQIWEAMGDEERGQFSNFQEFFRSGIWKQILQQAQQDEAQGIASLGPRNMEPNRMGAEYGGRIGFERGTDDALMKKAQFMAEILNISLDEAVARVTRQSEGSFPRSQISPPQAPIRDWLDKIKEEGYPDRADFEDPGFPGGRGKIWGGKIPYEPSELQAYDQGERTGLPGRRQILVPSSFLNNKEDIREEQVGIETLRGRR